MRKLAVIFLSFFLNSCSLFEVYVEPKTANVCPPYGASLEQALKCASEWSEAYRKGLKSQAKLRTATGVTLIVLSGVALGYGITNGTGDTLTWLGIGGGVGYGAANWLANDSAQLGYVAGREAIVCAVAVVAPLSALPRGVTALQKDLSALETSISTSESALLGARNAHRDYKKVGGDAKVLAAADEQMTQATEAISAADGNYVSGMSLLGKIKGAAQALVNTVIRISTKVDDIIRQSLPSLQSLPLVIDGLAESAGFFAPAPPEVKAPASATLPTAKDLETKGFSAKREALQNALIALEDAIRKMNRVSRVVGASVTAVGNSVEISTLKGCGVSDDRLAPALSVNPSSVSISSSANAARRLNIAGGRAGYFAELVEAPVDKLSVSQAEPFSPRVLILAEAGAPAGSYTINVTDLAGATVQAILTIDPSANGEDSGEASCPTVGDEPTSGEGQLTQAQIFAVQRIIKVEADGTIGPATRAAVCDYQGALDYPQTGELTEQVVEAAVQESNQKDGIVEGASNAFERSLAITPDIVKELQGILQVPQNGKLDDATRTAIKAKDSDPEPTGELSKELLKQIMESE